MPRRPDPFSQSSFYDRLIQVIDEQRSREAEERNAEHDAEFEAERRAEQATQAGLLRMAGDALTRMVEHDTRRVVALEQIAERFDQVLPVLRDLSTYLAQFVARKAT